MLKAEAVAFLYAPLGGVVGRCPLHAPPTPGAFRLPGPILTSDVIMTKLALTHRHLGLSADYHGPNLKVWRCRTSREGNTLGPALSGC